jgi:hypothetical protein
MSFDQQPHVYDRLPIEVGEARKTGVMSRFPPEDYEAELLVYPKQVAVLQYSAEEAQRIAAGSSDES